MDPLADLDITVQSFDIPRTVSVYPDQAGVRWWTKAWFNNRKDGEVEGFQRINAVRVRYGPAEGFFFTPSSQPER